MTANEKVVKIDSRSIPFNLQQFYGTKYLWKVTPDSKWNKKKWGDVPVLGYVRADNEYYAAYAAYDKGIAIPNATYGLQFELTEPRKKPKVRHESNHKG